MVSPKNHHQLSGTEFGRTIALRATRYGARTRALLAPDLASYTLNWTRLSAVRRPADCQDFLSALCALVAKYFIKKSEKYLFYNDISNII